MSQRTVLLRELVEMLDAPRAFTTGRKVYEPDEKDSSAGAELKRQVLRGMRDAVVSDGQQLPEAVVLEQMLTDIEDNLSTDPEGPDFAHAVNTLLSLLDSA